MRIFYKLSFFTLFIAVASCEKKSNEARCYDDRDIQPSYESTEECENRIMLWLVADNQFRAVIVSDVPLYSGIEFSGYYERGETFLKLVDIIGNEVVLFRKGDFLIRNDVQLKQALIEGWKLQKTTSHQ